MRILVAMSGGVDSSVVAALLHEQGHEVIGATLQLYDHGAAISKKGACCAGQDIHDARNVAEHLGIPHYVLDREQRFRDAVIQDFADSYARGETPIPCIRCNQSVKFHDLTELAADLGCEMLATGHYAQRLDGPELHMAADPVRDQSYFLAHTTRAQLARTLFPLGGFASKAEVRAHAARLGVAVAEKPDSQDICFVPTGTYADVVAKFRPEALEPGEIVDAEGKVLPPVLSKKEVQLRDTGAVGRRKLVRLWIPRGCGPREIGDYEEFKTIGDWAESAIEDFDKIARGFLRRDSHPDGDERPDGP